MIKKIIFIILLLILFIAVPSKAQIMCDRDTLCIPFWPSDSLGTPVALAAGDSVIVQVFSPNGTLIYADTTNGSDGCIESDGGSYLYCDLISTLNGLDTSKGAFTAILTVRDNSLAWLGSRFVRGFQIINNELSPAVDSSNFISAAYFGMRPGEKAFSKYGTDIDSVYVVNGDLDTISVMLYYHLGKEAGYRPDSVKIVSWGI